jgi:alanine racemase
MAVATIDEASAGGRLRIDLGALAANWRSLAARTGPAVETAAVVKADGYGLGIEPVARALAAAGCRTFFVALPGEGIGVRNAVPSSVIYILAGLLPGAAPLYRDHDLRPVLGSPPEVSEWAAAKRQGLPTQAAVHVDTGMNRLGLSFAEARKLATDAAALSAVAPALVMSHLACSDEPTNPENINQLNRFGEVVGLFPGVPASLANSGGVLLGADYHFQMVRPGIALYGGEVVAGVPNPMRPVVTLEARVLMVRRASAGEAVGYGGTRALKRPSLLAVVGVGYADGYHRRTGTPENPARVFVGGRFAPIAGRVSMDLITIDVTDVPGVARGDWVELFGANVPVDEAAAHAGTIGYEFLTGLGRRYHRTYAP